MENDHQEIPVQIKNGMVIIPAFTIPFESRCAECGWLLKRVTPADGQCTCNEILAAEIVYEDILDAEVLDL